MAMNPRFSIMNYLFSFGGRINRAKYWAFIGLTILYSFVLGAVSSIFAPAIPDPADPSAGQTAGVIVALLELALFLPYLVASLAVSVKRWHDRDKSGWWVLIGFVPIIGTIWTFVECGCLRGTDGDNRFGPDPLAPGLETVFE